MMKRVANEKRKENLTNSTKEMQIKQY